MNQLSRTLCALLTAALAACGSASGPRAAATTLDYTDPAGSSWRLVRDASSTPTRLVLDLVGPAGTLSRGVGFNLQLPPEVKAVTFDSSHLAAEDPGVYELGSKYGFTSGTVPPPAYPADYREPTAFAAGLKPGNLLTVGIFQKDRYYTAKDSGVALVRVALELRADAAPRAGDPVTLSVPKAKFIPADIGELPAFDDDAATAQAKWEDCRRKGRVEPITVAVGTLVAR